MKTIKKFLGQLDLENSYKMLKSSIHEFELNKNSINKNTEDILIKFFNEWKMKINEEFAVWEYKVGYIFSRLTKSDSGVFAGEFFSTYQAYVNGVPLEAEPASDIISATLKGYPDMVKRINEVGKRIAKYLKGRNGVTFKAIDPPRDRVLTFDDIVDINMKEMKKETSEEIELSEFSREALSDFKKLIDDINDNPLISSTVKALKKELSAQRKYKKLIDSEWVYLQTLIVCSGNPILTEIRKLHDCGVIKDASGDGE